MSSSNPQPLKIGREVIEHWYVLVPGQKFSTQEFYSAVESEVKAQEVPALKSLRVDLLEGGPLSDKREYLRFKRERLTFDVCAAPVGMNYFFSYRFTLDPRRPSLVEVIVLLLVIAGLGFAAYWGIELSIIATVAAVAALAAYLYFRDKDTYYRQDVRLAYCSIVSAIVKRKVDAVTADEGVKLCREWSYNPVLGGLYASNERSPAAAPAPARA